MKLIPLNILLLSCLVTNAQSLEEGKKQLYYERYGSALQSFQTALKQDAGNGEAWLGLTKTYILLKQFKNVNDTLKQAPATVTNDPYFRIATGSNALQQNKKDEAFAIFKKVLEDFKKKNEDLIAAIAWAQVNSQNGDAVYAVDIINKGIRKAKNKSELYALQGDAWRKLSNGTEAFKAYQKAIDEDNKYAVAYYRMGQIFLSQKNTAVYPGYFEKAVTADTAYAPAWYRLYLYEFNRDPSKAIVYYKKYSANADQSIQTEYDLADLLYLNKNYDKAIAKAKGIIMSTGEAANPRLYKLISYSYAGKKDTAQAISQMKKYFENEADTNIIAKDYEAMSEFYTSTHHEDSLAGVYLARAATMESDSLILFDYYKRLSDLAKERKDYKSQAEWLGKYYTGNGKASNLDLFYWGVANYRIEDYPKADSIFGIYIQKYPDENFGYYWQAKSKALQDKDMASGLAVPSYQKLVEVLQKDTTDSNYKKWIVEAYGYLAAYEVNSEKDYAEAINYFEKTLIVDPENVVARKYIDMLEKRLKDPGETDKGN